MAKDIDSRKPLRLGKDVMLALGRTLGGSNIRDIFYRSEQADPSTVPFCPIDIITSRYDGPEIVGWVIQPKISKDPRVADHLEKAIENSDLYIVTNPNELYWPQGRDLPYVIFAEMVRDIHQIETSKATRPEQTDPKELPR